MLSKGGSAVPFATQAASPRSRTEGENLTELAGISKSPGSVIYFHTTDFWNSTSFFRRNANDFAYWVTVPCRRRNWEKSLLESILSASQPYALCGKNNRDH